MAKVSETQTVSTLDHPIIHPGIFHKNYPVNFFIISTLINLLICAKCLYKMYSLYFFVVNADAFMSDLGSVSYGYSTTT